MDSSSTLFSPISIGTMELKNRVAMAAMATDYADDGGRISQKLRDYHEARARGGVGLITLGVTSVDGRAPYSPHAPGLWDDESIPSFKELTAAVHAYGAKLVPQISHPGPESLSPFFYKIQPVGPSPVMCHPTKQMCRELALEEIQGIVEQFGDAARRAREGGCDGVELHAAHSYMLVGSFLSPLRNRRTDAYGGSIEGRLKFPLEVISSIRSKAGPDFPIIMRLSGDELVPGGRDLRETQYTAPILAEAGVAAFHVSCGVIPTTMWRVLPPAGTTLCINAAFSAAVKAVVDVPVMVVGRIVDPRLAEDVLNRNEADMVVIGRALLADPEWPNKAAEGRFEDIAPCIGCGLGCLWRGPDGRAPMTCLVNPTVGREREMALTPAVKSKRVLVAGGGPGGLEVGRVAALRGHHVTISEKGGKLGGQFNLAAVPPLKHEFCKLIRYLAIQVEKAGGAIQLKTEVTPKLVEEVKPDVVVVATGGEALVPDMPGVKGDRVVSAHDILAGRAVVRSGNVLVVGGGSIGCEVAAFLADSGDNPVIGRCSVTIVEKLKNVCLDMVPEARTLLMQRLRENGVRILTSATVKEFLEDGVVIVRDEQEEAIRGMNRVVLAMGVQSVDGLSDRIGTMVPEVYVIGDAKEPRKALEAIAEGAGVGRAI